MAYKQLEQQNVDVDAIRSEWISLKSILSRWDKEEFPSSKFNKKECPTLDWAMIMRKIARHDNFFALVDYFLC